MGPTIIIIALIIVIAYLLVDNMKTKDNKKTNTETTNEIQQYPYEKKYLLTKTEYTFYNKLKDICDEKQMIICPKVRLEDFIKVTTKENIMKYRGYIKSRHIDFLICDNKLNIIMGLELDDNSHDKESVKKTDNFKNKLFETIGIPLERIKVTSNDYNMQITTILNKYN